MARPCKRLAVNSADRAQLEQWTRAGTTPKRLVERAEVILGFSDGRPAREISKATGLSYNAVCRWRQRFEADGIQGLEDLPRPGQPRKLTPRKAREILRLTVEKIPRESTHWSLRLMAKRAGVTVHQVRQVWKSADLKPHRLRSFKISNDPLFAEKVQDVVGLYLDPPANSMVLSVDEKTQIQALDRTQPLLPMKPGQVERRTHDYTRHGTRSLYAAFDVASGEVIGRVTRRHRAREFLAFLNQIDRSTDPGLELHVILDNSSTHKTPAVKRWLEGHPRFHFHFTPTSASWLNAVETWFAQLERRAIHRGIFTSVLQLRDEIHRYIQVHNAELAKPFRWTKTAAAILEKQSRLAKRLVTETNQTGH